MRKVVRLASVTAATVIAALGLTTAATAAEVTVYERYDDGSAAATLIASPLDPWATVCSTGVDGFGDVAITRPQGSNFYDYDLGGSDPYRLQWARAGEAVSCADFDGNGFGELFLRRGNVFYFGPDIGSAGIPVTGTQSFGKATDEFLAGDWDGDGYATLGLRRGNQFFMSNTRAGSGPPVVAWSFLGGRATDKVVVGDWDGDGVDTIGVVRGNQWFLTNTTNGAAPAFGSTFLFGRSTDMPLAGDWNGDGDTEAGIARVTAR